VIQFSKPDPGPTLDEALAALLAMERTPLPAQQEPSAPEPEPEGEQ
jgi:hypothetical protein